MGYLPKAPIKRALHDSKGYRVSDDAVDAVYEFMENTLASLADDASKITCNDGRKTIYPKDINVAIDIGYS